MRQGPQGHRLTRLIGVAGVVLVAAGPLARPAQAQQRPLVTQDPETIGAGNLLIESGIDYSKDQLFPASGLKGNLFRLAVTSLDFGLSSIADFQISGGPYNRLAINERRVAPLSDMVTATGDSTQSVDDVVVATKIRILSETGSRPAVGVRFATRLPNAGNESGLGLDTTDFLFTLLAAKTVESIRLVGNLGLGILGEPTRGDDQNDVLLYGVSFARAMTSRYEVVGEVNGRWSTRSGTPPAGTESRGAFRLATRYTRGPLRLDAGLFVGLTSRDATIGVTTGFTYVINAFRVP